MILGLWIALAWADPEDALGPVARQLYAEARQREMGGDLAHAASLYRAVWATEPNFYEALVDLAEVLELQGDIDGAVAALEEAPYDADAVEALGRLLLRRDRPEDAVQAFRKLRDLAPESQRGLVLEATAMSRYDAIGAHELALRALGSPMALDGDGERLVVDIAAALRKAGDREREQALLDAALAEWPELQDGPERPAWFGDLWDRAEIEQLARRLAGARPDGLTGDQRLALEGARAAFARGDLAGAKRALLGLTQQAPRNPEAWAALADVYQALGDIGAAEQALLTAEAFDPLDARAPARRGQILAGHYCGTRDGEAARALQLSLLLDPAQPDLWTLLGTVERTRRREELTASISAWRRALKEMQPGSEEAAAMTARLVDCDRKPPVPPSRLPGPAELEPYWVAEAYYRNGRPERAAEEVEAALAADPSDVRALHLRARILLDEGRDSEAMAAWKRSLELKPDQPDVRARLGEIAMRDGRTEEAMASWAEAAAQGSADARFLLAKQAKAEGRLYDARELLDAYFAGATSGDHHDEAVLLRRTVARDIARRWYAGSLFAAVAVVAPAWIWRRRRAGVDLEAVLRASPSAWRDVARTCSVIRHEVLKHNTTLLPVVAEALERGDAAPAGWAADRLFGPRGALERFFERIADLETMARLHGLRLNLRHRDPVLGPVVRAMDALARLEKDLRRGNPRIAGELRSLSRALNEDGYHAIGQLVRRLCLLPLDERLIEGVWKQVGAAFPDHRVRFEVHLEERPYLRISRGDLEDILANVLRNGLQASIEAEAPRMGLLLATEEDEITGLERVVLRVCDLAPRRISTAIVRGRYIERGLGLTVDLISRNAGSIHVEDEPGWSKAVVVRLPRAEAPSVNVEEEP